ncbi:MAG: hypothetical protein JW936_00025 [Sedimentisphaerales bacterium]|nr:hypothetical protein [Sedimentisphaerales bacterium]
MNRLFRRNRRQAHRNAGQLFSSSAHLAKPPASLTLEPLEGRLLLTTLTLPAGTTGETIFRYADPEDTGVGDEVSTFNEIRIGTLSGEAPSQDVVVEVLNYQGQNIPGTLTIPGQGTSDLFGGPGGIAVIERIDELGFSVNCLATNSLGETYGIDETGRLLRISPQAPQLATVIGTVEDTNAVGANGGQVNYTTFQAAEFDPNIDGFMYVVAEGPISFDANGDPIAVGQVLISVDVTTGEADAVGHDQLGIARYSLSEVGTQSFDAEITTIVYSQEGHNANNMGLNPVFIGYDAGNSGRFVTIEVSPGLLAAVDVATATLVAVDPENTRIDGLMYGQDKLGNPHLFGLDSGEGRQVLVEVNLADGSLTDLFAYPEGVNLTGMSYDDNAAIGYASDPNNGDLYRINTASLGVDDEGNLVVEGGLGDVYTVYVTSTTPDVYITFTYLTIDSDGVPTYMPTAGSPAQLFVDEDESLVTTPDEAGGVMIGTGLQKDEDDKDIWSPGNVGVGNVGTFFNSKAFAPNTSPVGVWPGGDLRPGIFVMPDSQGNPQDIGLIQVGGGVFGDVEIHGSIGRFYAGYLATNTFAVDGDLQSVVVHTQAGGIAESDNSWQPVDDAILEVGGVMGSFYSQGDWGLPVYVHGQSNAPQFPGVLDIQSNQYIRSYREIERKYDDVADDHTRFMSGSLETNDDYIVTNDTFDTAEFLGTIDGKIVVCGKTEDIVWDYDDFYSFGVMAGQTINITLYYTGYDYNPTNHPVDPNSLVVRNNDLALYDPDQVRVGQNGEADIATGTAMSVTYTAEQAGIYTIQIGSWDGNLYVNSYRIEISGVSETTFGGGNVLTDVRDDTLIGGAVGNNTITVTSGNMGALNVNGVFRSGAIDVNEGSLAAVRTGFLDADFGYHWEINDAGGSITDNPSITVGGDIGMVSSPANSVVNIFSGSDIQSVRMGVNYAGQIVAQDNIGEIVITGDYGPTMLSIEDTYYLGIAPGIFANSDGLGGQGIIDNIYVGGLFGRSFGYVDTREIPVSVGPLGGNVRFVEIVGAIYQTIGGSTSGGGWGPFEFAPGQAVLIADDSGSTVWISPGHLGSDDVEDYLFGAAPPPGYNEPVTGDGGVLTLKLLPVRDVSYAQYTANPLVDTDETILGYAIAEVTSTDGLRITSVGGPSDIGVVNVSGVIDNSVIAYGNQEVSMLRLNANGGISRVYNNTTGDMVSIVIGEAADDTGTGTGTGTGDDEQNINVSSSFEIVSVRGHLGWTDAITGQRIQTIEIAAADEIEIITDANDRDLEANNSTDPVGSQHTGLVSAQGIQTITIGASLGDTNLSGSVERLILNNDGSAVPGQFDGITGAVVIEGNLDYVQLGDGVADPGRGRYALSGLFVTGHLGQAAITGVGHDINGPIFAAGGIDVVNVTNGARIVGYNGISEASDRVRGVYYSFANIAAYADFDNFIDGHIAMSGSIGSVNVTGAGSELYGASIQASSIASVNISGGANGMFYSQIGATSGYYASAVNIGSVTVGGQGIHDSRITAARKINSITTTGTATIEYSEILSSLNIGSIRTSGINQIDISAFNKLDTVMVTGEIYDVEIEAGELGMLYASRDILGSAIYVGGPVNFIYAGRDLISSMTITGPNGDLRTVMAGRDIGTPTGGIITVDGKIGMISAGDDFLAELLVNWDPNPAGPANPLGPHQKYSRNDVILSSLRAGGTIAGLGDIGGHVGTIMSGDTFGQFGSELRIHGNLSMIMVGPGAQPTDMDSGLTVDGNLGVAYVFGSVNGQINVLDNFGTMLLLGRGARADLNASISVGANFGTMIIINGDISATDVTNGQPLTINVAGTGPRQIIIGSDIDGHEISGGGTGWHIDGSINGSYMATDSINGTIDLGGGIGPDGVLVIDGDLDVLRVAGDIEGTVHVTGNIGQIIAANISSTATITAGGNITDISVPGTVGNAYILAGFDPGLTSTVTDLHLDIADGVFDSINQLTVQGTNIDPNEHATAGTINTANIGTLWNSVVAAGVSPGFNATFGEPDGSDQPGNGISSINFANIGVVVGDGLGNPFGVFADSSIGVLTIGGTYLPTPVSLPTGFRAWTVQESGTGPIGGTPITGGVPEIATVGTQQFIIFLTGPGRGEYTVGLDQIDTIKLADTTAASSLFVLPLGGAINVGHLITVDDAAMGTIMINGRLSNAANNATMNIDGGVTNLRISGIGAGSTVNIDGSMTSANFGTVDAGATTITIDGDVRFMSAQQMGLGVSITADQVSQFMTYGPMNAMLNCVDGDMSFAYVMGNLGGVISTEGTINTTFITGQVTGGLRAGQDLRFVSAGSMYGGTIAAGRDLRFAQINGNVTYSNIASGLDIGPAGDPYSDTGVVAGQGDLDRLYIAGNFVQSNIVAGLAPGVDNLFATGDDQMDQRFVENVDAPQVVDIRFPDVFTIEVEFRKVQQISEASDIGTVTIAGRISGSSSAQDHFAIAATGTIDRVIANRATFNGTENLTSSIMNDKGVLASSITSSNIDSEADALLAAFRVRTDGLDGVFGTADDVYVCGDNNPQTTATVWVTFDQETNTASFHNSEGFVPDSWASNYYEVRLDAGQVVNRQGVALDGEVDGTQWPTGNGVPGGDFVYYFAVADIGGTVATAYSPFAENSFAENTWWKYRSRLGDDITLDSDNLITDTDYYRLNDLEAGQLLNIQLSQEGLLDNAWWWNNETEIKVEVLRISDDLQAINDFPAIDRNGFELPDEDEPIRDIVIPGLDEIAYDGNDFFAYENRGGTFYQIDSLTKEITLLPNNMDELNGLVAQFGNITDFNGFTAHSLDSFWAVATFVTTQGASSNKLVRVDKLSEDISNLEPWQRAGITVYPNNVGYDSIVGMVELDGVLYGVDADTHTLVTINTNYNVANPMSGVATAVGNLGDNRLVITGLAADPSGDFLIALHDQPIDELSNLLDDAIYSVDINTGHAALLRTLLSASNEERHGMAATPSGEIWVGQPLRGTPVGDTFEITFGDWGMQEHIFATSLTDFGHGGNTVDSNAGRIFINTGQQQFVNGGFYWVMNITYARTPGLGAVPVTISDINWINDTENGVVQSVVTDDPDSVTAGLGADGTIQLLINTETGDGDFTLYFAGTSIIDVLPAPQVEDSGKVIGNRARNDFNPRRDLIMPNLAEFDYATHYISRDLAIELTPALDDALDEVLSPEQMNDLYVELTEQLYVEIYYTLIDYPDLLEDFQDAVTQLTYELVGYDAQQELFSLHDVETAATIPILVEHPNDPGNLRMLTCTLLGQIYTATHGGSLTFDSVTALEFGQDDVLWMIATVTDTSTGITRDSLLGVEDITDPAAGMYLSSVDIAVNDPVQGVVDFDIAGLAFGLVSDGPGETNGKLYAVDSNNRTLMILDHRWQTSTTNSDLVPNPNYGEVSVYGGEIGNLGTADVNIVDIEFDTDGRLYALEDNSDILLEVNTDIVRDTDTARLHLVDRLPAGDYSAMTISPRPYSYIGMPQDQWPESLPLIVRGVTGSPVDIDSTTPGNQGDVIEISVNGGTPQNHTFGGSNTTVSGVVFNSAANGTALATAAGGYYNVAITYTTGQGDLTITLADIDWPTGSSGDVDSVILSDGLHAQVDTFNAEGCTITVDTDTGSGNIIIYFGATSDLVTLDIGASDSVVYSLSSTIDTSIDKIIQIPDDGDYIIAVSGISSYSYSFYGYYFDFSQVGDPISYELSMMLFNDGNSDFSDQAIVCSDGFVYDPYYPNNSAVDLTTGSDDIDPDPTNPNSYQNHPLYPIEVEGSLTTGVAGTVVIDTEITNRLDTDVYTLQLLEGQRITVDIDADALFGRDGEYLFVGIYNSDLESIATVADETDDTLPSQQADPHYTAQAIFEMPNHPGVVIDPDVNGVGTYYVVVSGYHSQWEASPYRLTINTSNPEPVTTPSSQLVYLNFEGGVANYLVDENYGLGGTTDTVNRPAFDASDFGLQNVRTGLINDITAQIEQIYRDAGLTANEIEFTTTKPALGRTYSTVFFGGRTAIDGVLGIAQHVDRHNSDRNDQACVLTEEFAMSYEQYLSDDFAERYDQVVNMLANTGAHELAHNLGLEHAREVNIPENEQYNNLMAYYNFETRVMPHELEERNSPIAFTSSGSSSRQIGFSNEIDMLLRSIGAGTAMGS